MAGTDGGVIAVKDASMDRLKTIAASTQFIRPKFLPNRLYHLHCEVETDPFPTESELRTTISVAGNRFIRDMRKQGWEHQDGYGYQLSPPKPTVQRGHRGLPSVFQQSKYSPSNYVQEITTGPQRLLNADGWSYFLTMAFIRKAVVTEFLTPEAGDSPTGLWRGEPEWQSSMVTGMTAKQFLEKVRRN